MSTQIILISHAITQWNMDGKDQGHVDTPLNAYGFRMAKAVAEKLREEKIDAIFSSDLTRAYQTAEPLSVIKGMSVTKLVCLRECRKIVEDTGEYKMLPFEVEVESREELRKRVAKGITEIVENNDGKNIFIVSHEGAVKQFVEYLKGLPGSRVPDYKGIRSSINRFSFEAGSWTCMVMNDGDFLNGIWDGVSSI